MLDKIDEWIEICRGYPPLAHYVADLQAARAELVRVGENDSTARMAAGEQIRLIRQINREDVESAQRIRKAAKMKPVDPTGETGQGAGGAADNTPSTDAPAPPDPPAPPSAPNAPAPPSVKLAGSAPPSFKNRRNPTGVKTPVSKAFKAKLKPDMFEKPDDMEEAALSDACLKFNFALTNAKRVESSSEVFKKLVAAGLPEAAEAGAIPPGDLDKYTRIVWEIANEGNRKHQLEAWRAENKPEEDFAFTPTAFPETGTIKEMMVEWKPGQPLDEDSDIFRARASEIGSAKVDKARPQKAMIKRENLDNANERLKAMGSFIKLEIAGDPDDNGFVPVRPIFNPEHAATPDPKGRDDHTVLEALNAKRQGELAEGTAADTENRFVSWADCHRTAQLIMGSEDQPGGFEDRERPVLRGTRGEIVVEPVSMSGIQFIEQGSNSGANRAMHGFFNEAIPSYFSDFEDKDEDDMLPAQKAVKDQLEMAKREQKQTIEAAPLMTLRRELDTEFNKRKGEFEEPEQERLSDLLAKCGRLLEVGKLYEMPIAERLDVRRERIDEANEILEQLQENLNFRPDVASALTDVPLNLRGAYREICKDPAMFDDFSKQFGINKYCQPEIGDALTQVNDEGMKISKEGEGEDIWNFHWAGVVLVNEDGSFLTLENLSVEDMRAVNNDWYFAAYKPGEESFHAINEKDSHVTDFPLTMAMKKVM